MFIEYIITAFAMIFVIEGMLYAVFPEQMRRVLMMALALPPSTLRMFGAVMVVLGFVLVSVLSLFMG